MNEEKKVYIVTSGYYSDYHIVAVFDSKEKAEEYVDSSPQYDIHEPEEWTLNGEQPDRSEHLFCVRSSFTDINPVITSPLPLEEYCDFLKDAIHYNGSDIYLHIASDSREKALKIAAERIRQVKAEEHWKYPLLRRLVITQSFPYGKMNFPTYDFLTGDIILEEDQDLIKEAYPEGLEHSIKVRRVKNEDI